MHPAVAQELRGRARLLVRVGFVPGVLARRRRRVGGGGAGGGAGGGTGGSSLSDLADVVVVPEADEGDGVAQQLFLYGLVSEGIGE